jgi:hypothetical protein
MRKRLGNISLYKRVGDMSAQEVVQIINALQTIAAELDKHSVGKDTFQWEIEDYEGS